MSLYTVSGVRVGFRSITADPISHFCFTLCVKTREDPRRPGYDQIALIMVNQQYGKESIFQKDKQSKSNPKLTFKLK